MMSRVAILVALALAACTSAPVLPSDSGAPSARASATTGIACDPSATPILIGPHGTEVVLGDGPGGTSQWISADAMSYFLRQIGDCIWVIGYMPLSDQGQPFFSTFQARLGTDFRVVGTFSDVTGVLVRGYDAGSFVYEVTFDGEDTVLVEDRSHGGPPGCSSGDGVCPPPRELRRVEDLRIESVDFEPAFTAILPHGWTSEPHGFLPEESEDRHLDFNRDWVVMSASCELEPEPGVGVSAEQQVTALADRDGLLTTRPQAVVIGGLSGQQLDLALADGWTGACPWTLGAPTVPLIGKFDGENQGFVAVEPGERWRLILLDAPGGGIVTVDIYTTGGGDFETHLAESMAILESLEFDVP